MEYKSTKNNYYPPELSQKSDIFHSFYIFAPFFFHF